MEDLYTENICILLRDHFTSEEAKIATDVIIRERIDGICYINMTIQDWRSCGVPYGIAFKLVEFGKSGVPEPDEHSETEDDEPDSEDEDEIPEPDEPSEYEDEDDHEPDEPSEYEDEVEPSDDEDEVGYKPDDPDEYMYTFNRILAKEVEPEEVEVDFGNYFSRVLDTIF